MNQDRNNDDGYGKTSKPIQTANIQPFSQQ